MHACTYVCASSSEANCVMLSPTFVATKPQTATEGEAACPDHSPSCPHRKSLRGKGITAVSLGLHVALVRGNLIGANTLYSVDSIIERNVA